MVFLHLFPLFLRMWFVLEPKGQDGLGGENVISTPCDCNLVPSGVFVKGGVACLSLGAELRVSALTITSVVLLGDWKWCFVGGLEVASCISATRCATATVALECSSMSSRRLQLSCVLWGGLVACLPIGMQLHVSPSTRTETWFCMWVAGGGGSCMCKLGMQLQV